MKKNSGRCFKNWKQKANQRKNNGTEKIRLKVTLEYYLGLGSNLSSEYGNSLDILTSSLRDISAQADINLLECSSFYESKPLGPQNQNDYINAALKITSNLDPRELLKILQKIEEKYGRNRLKEVRWGARTLDIDILLAGSKTVNNKELCIPHKELENRAFVLIPLYELNPKLTLPNGKNIESLAENCDQTGIIKLKKP
jgi:2-amino-4-hydroxy-6-hydroxymethyldihydropteridine diphosphokinase